MLYVFNQFVFAELISDSDTEHVEQRDKQFIMRNNHLIRLIIDVLVIVSDKLLSLYSAGVLESEE